jgi:hypothetical protein
MVVVVVVIYPQYHDSKLHGIHQSTVQPPLRFLDNQFTRTSYLHFRKKLIINFFICQSRVTVRMTVEKNHKESDLHRPGIDLGPHEFNTIKMGVRVSPSQALCARVTYT